jgi:hypothetical protein
MTEPAPPQTSATPALPATVPVKLRLDGWTAARQRQFLDALADSGCVSIAARAVGMSKESAYRLRRRAGAEGFARAWDGAIAHGIRRLGDAALERALLGEEVPVYHKGELVGTRRRYSDRLTTFLLRHHNPAVYGDPYDHNLTNPRDRLSRKVRDFAPALDGLDDAFDAETDAG